MSGRLVLALGAALLVTAAAFSEVWPQPATFTQGVTSVSLDPTQFTIACSGPCPAPLPDAFKRYIPLIFVGTSKGALPKPAKTPSGLAAITGITVTVTGNASLEFGMDESYNLSVSAFLWKRVSCPRIGLT